ncbi:snaclec VP12 subunit B-like [Haliotis rubra]|uniref:snaclec VP12 subunit B-like n=1 Tax=Haliotis rubra TaxID=36100 RepID=UPI001EE58D8A|nr:snaclec VP12 subunit B-like [Haliotis rubra]
MYLGKRIVWQWQSDDLAHCASDCAANGNCASFFYNFITRNCRLHRKELPALGYGTADHSNWIAYDVPDPTGCRDTDGYVLYKLTSLCYKVHTEEKDWDQARSVCHSENAELVTLQTTTRKTAIESVVLHGDSDNVLYLGGRDYNGDGTWRWINDNSSISWAADIASDNANCLGITFADNRLVYEGHDCDSDNQFICEKGF